MRPACSSSSHATGTGRRRTRRLAGPARRSGLSAATAGSGRELGRTALRRAAGDGDETVDKFRYDAFLGTNLDFLLRARGIRTVVCTGTATNVCVKSTARAAHMRDYHLVLIGDCCASTNQDLHDATLRNVERSFGIVTSAETVVEVWQSTRAAGGRDLSLILVVGLG